MNSVARYRRSPARRLRALLLTDRVGHTIALLLGLVKVLRWSATHLLRRLVRRR